MSQESARGEVAVLRFLGFELDQARGELRRDGQPVEIHRKPLQLLGHLVMNRHRTVPANELFQELWPDVSVTDQALSSALRDLRRVLGDRDRTKPIIATLRGRGYRFLPKVEQPTDPGGASNPRAHELGDREEVMETLVARLDQAVSGTSQLSLLCGPPGIGKTRVTEELAKLAASREVDVLVGRCHESEQGVSFGPFLQALRHLIARRGLNEARRCVRSESQAIGLLMPELAEAAGAPGDYGFEERSEARFRLYDAIAVYLGDVSAERPLLLVIDDLQWADDASLRLLEFLWRHLGAARVHLLGAARDVELDTNELLRVTLGRLGADRRVDLFELKNLSREAIAQLLGPGHNDCFVDSVVSSTGGNPFFVTEVLRLLQSGKLQADDQQLTTGAPPRSICDAVQLQLRTRSPACVSLLELAAVVGRDFDLALLSQAARLPSTEALSLLDEAAHAGLICALPDGVDRYGFMHDLTREAIYAELPRATRAQHHAGVAMTLERMAGPDPSASVEALAHQYALAASAIGPEKAVHYARRAAERALRVQAYENAVGLLGRALDLLRLDPDPDPRLRCELMVSQAEAMWATAEQFETVIARFDEATELARAIGAGELFARAVLGRAVLGAVATKGMWLVDERDVSLLEEARTMPGADVGSYHALVLARLANTVWYKRGFEAALALSEEAVALARQLGHAETLARVLYFHHDVLWGPDYIGERAKIATEIIAIAKDSGLRLIEIDARHLRGRDRLEMGDVMGATLDSRDAGNMSKLLRHPGALYRVGIAHIEGLLLTGRLEGLREKIDEFCERDRPRNVDAAGTRYAQVLSLLMIQGKHEEALEFAAKQPKRYDMTPWVPCHLARVHVELGQLEIARDHYERFSKHDFENLPRDHIYTACIAALAETAVALEDRRAAERLYELLRPYEETQLAPFLATICEGSVHRPLGLLAELLGRHELAERHLGAALKFHSKWQWPPLTAMSLVDLGAYRLHRGDQAAGRERLLEAREIAQRVGMNGLLRRIDRLMAGSPPAQTRSSELPTA